MTQTTFFWHDYETWGADPRRDRPSQFAGIRTDLDFNTVGDPVMLYCAPSDDILPSPDACLVTGLTPQRVRQEGVNEAAFFSSIHQELARSGTCGVGYNSLRFDDEVTRFGLYRNFFDPYAREWQNGNSRWDIIDMVRLTRALRPEGINWPERDDGSPSFRLEELTAANDISHEGAHDALADVHATIALARLIKERQPRLYDYVFQNRGKRLAADLLNWRRREMMLHVSRRIPAELGCISPIVPLTSHPTNRNSVVCFDLRHDPEPLLEMDADQLRDRLYTPTSELPEGEKRVALKEVHLNKCPVLVPVNTLTPEAAREWQIDLDEARTYRDRLDSATNLSAKLAEIYGESRFGAVSDPDLALYDGFLSEGDRRLADTVRRTAPEKLSKLQSGFEDSRLGELLFRYQARNWPDRLDPEQAGQWQKWRLQRLLEAEGEAEPPIAGFRARIQELMKLHSGDARATGILEAVASWPAEIGLPAA